MNFQSRPVLGLVAISLFLVSGCLHASVQARIPSAFSAVGSPAADRPANLQERGVRRIRPVTLNMDVLNNTKLPSMQMSFFPDVDLTIAWSRVEKVVLPPGFAWTGKVTGSSGAASMVVSGKTVTANITAANGMMYQIRTTEDGRWWVRELDPASFPRESAPVVPGRE